ncbi:MAG TPA: hypothetical protein VJN02_11925 [Gammaproteobacteria bacterium]|nr:MAG: hypothetical protein A3E83_06810 [Gammaproteobacteria bacterium RIFCSPHIGHO2_12_FULL_41_20]HLB43529.1 hypothetical protein [Gammaproteobacteria bacterium]
MEYFKAEESLVKHGYVILNFSNTENLYKIQKIINSVFPITPTYLQNKNIKDDEYLFYVKTAKDKIVASGLVKGILLENIDFFTRLLGPDIDFQSNLHLRVSRPYIEQDFIDWHRDTFNGNTFWEINIWFPVFPLEKGAGLNIIKNSHILPSQNIQYVNEKNEFRSKITKGSVASTLGYLYAIKTDDVISQLNPDQEELLTPQLGQFILFFGYLAHRAQNFSSLTRISVDLRLKSMFAPTNTKHDYYQPLTRGAVATYIQKITKINEYVGDS